MSSSSPPTHRCQVNVCRYLTKRFPLPRKTEEDDDVISKHIRDTISAIEAGKVFGIEELGLSREDRLAAAQALSRMVKAGAIERISPGYYYKPKVTPFGPLDPSMEEYFKDLLFDGQTPKGYLTGYYAFNLLGLTTQLPVIIEIATRYPQRSKQRGIYSIRFVLQKNEIKRGNIKLLRLLDCLKWIKNIPDASIEKSYASLRRLVGELSDKERQMLVDLSLLYSPATRALLGSMLQEGSLTEKLWETLNPLTQYRIGLSSPDLSDSWNIV